jgi:hypothetical protein
VENAMGHKPCQYNRKHGKRFLQHDRVFDRLVFIHSHNPCLQFFPGLELPAPDVLDDVPDGLGYLVPAVADWGDRVVIVEAELLKGIVRFRDVFDLLYNPVKILFQYFP